MFHTTIYEQENHADSLPGNLKYSGTIYPMVANMATSGHSLRQHQIWSSFQVNFCCCCCCCCRCFLSLSLPLSLLLLPLPQCLALFERCSVFVVHACRVPLALCIAFRGWIGDSFKNRNNQSNYQRYAPWSKTYSIVCIYIYHLLYIYINMIQFKIE